jgi:uncharacterized membrane protein
VVYRPKRRLKIKVGGGGRRSSITGVLKRKAAYAGKTIKYVSKGRRTPYILLSLMILAYAIVFTAITLDQYNMFWYGNFDLGIPDQGIWLLSQFKTPYLTTRGLHLFGDHTSFIHILVAPLYWIWDDVRALLILHTVTLAAGALPVYLIARDRFESNWIPLAFSFCYLLYPAVHYSNLDQGYHYETFMVPFTLFGYWFLMHAKYGAYYVMFFLSLICKEEISFSYILFGIYVFFVFNKRVGAVTTVSSVIWVLLVMNVFFPYFNTEGAFYTGRTLGSFGKTTPEKAKNLVNPVFMFNKVVTMKNLKYFMGVLFPTAFLVFHDLPSFAVSASFYLNLITDWPYAHELRYHYVTPIIPFVFISVINGVGRYRKRRGVVYGLLLLFVVTTFVSNEYIGPGEAKISNRERIWDTVMKGGVPHGEFADILLLMDEIPSDARVSASYNFVSHLSHRERIYMFPNPFRINLYGIDEKGIHPDKDVDYVILDMRLVGNEMPSVRKVNESGRYELVDSHMYVNLYRNVDYRR